MKLLTRAMVAIIERMMDSEHVREAVWRTGRDLFAQRPFAPFDVFEQPPLPERFFRQPAPGRADKGEKSPIFITARFRSGSTFLWNLFRSLPGVTAYYEPLNENRWFLKEGAGGQVDSTHLGVSDYRREYKGIADLDGMFRDSWAFRELYMDQMHYDPALYRYLVLLIEHAEGRPVLQFNRADFRLPWLKANFPRAQIIHLYRNPRETWMSLLGKGGTQVPLKGEWRPDHYQDLFYTFEWASDLKRVFPFLDPEPDRHPYAIHYHLWRLSYSFGVHYADCTLGYEDLVEDFAGQLPRLLDQVGIREVDIERLQRMNKGRVRNRWQDYAEADWFEEIERNCEREQRAFFYVDEGSAVRLEEHLFESGAMGERRRRV